MRIWERLKISKKIVIARSCKRRGNPSTISSFNWIATLPLAMTGLFEFNENNLKFKISALLGLLYFGRLDEEK